MRVLLTTPYDLAVPGGVNRHALDLLETLLRKGIEVRLIGPSSAETPEIANPSIHRIGRIWVGALNGARSRVTLDLGIGTEVKRLIRDFRPDVIHLQEPFLPTLNTFALIHAGGARTVGTFHTYSETSRGYLWAWPWCRWVNRRLDARVAVSASAREFATRWHPRPFAVVPNGVRLPDAAAMRPSRAAGRPVRVLFVGRADEPRKGFDVLKEAMRRLDAETPGAFTLDAVGPATARGEVSAAELSAAYAAADVCAVPSRGGESFGLVALEALAHGVPVVASRIRGYADWLDGTGTGRLVTAGDAAALAEALRAVTAYAAAYAACADRAREVASRYDWNRGVERLLRIYEGAPVSNDEG
ncbi:glycosyltransferase family 4 protein [Rariglobus hedericola]|uniref:Glycosyltransferase family 4 protein n=1 Tax=Rariglobus hedericola TaxID=2597822 RepID=A0A556QQX0_9BACT|nr:glycosyltransferase family 4 protein [Rariglobus hedericola]TSJ79019.1 glycosyltransferase family 4 protein [Rariglobus hedericola]